MGTKYTADELNAMGSDDLSRIILKQQDDLSRLNDNYEKLLEQLRVATQIRFGRHSEKLEVIDGQIISF